MSALEIIDQVPEFARLVALELKRNLEPHEDEISQNEAWKRYGRGWIVKLTERGLLHLLETSGNPLPSSWILDTP